MEFQVHDVEWSDDKVKRFWDFYNNYAAFEDLWFSKAVGKGIINFVQKFVKIKGSVLDYGIGKGHFSSYLLQKDTVQIFACDFSQETVNNINTLFKDKENFKGCSLVTGFPSSFGESEFDIVFLIEAIEHLTDKYLMSTLSEAYRILKPGGKLVITTPNNEKLDLSHVICPDCGGVFHRVQHVRSFTKKSLSHILSTLGFGTIHCDATDFNEHGERKALYKTRNTVAKAFKKSYQAPHLVYIGEKK